MYGDLASKEAFARWAELHNKTIRERGPSLTHEDDVSPEEQAAWVEFLATQPFDHLPEEEQEAVALAQFRADEICAYSDPFGGPCLLPKEGHPSYTRKAKVKLIHDDGRDRTRPMWLSKDGR